jgi:hypothetical protein
MDLEAAAMQFQDAILSVYSDNCPLIIRRNNRNVPWWNHDLAEKRRIVRRLFNAAKKSGNWTDYKRSLMDYNKALDRPRVNHGGDTVRRLRRLQEVPDSTEFSQRVGRVQLGPFSWIMEIIPYQSRRPRKNYCGFIFLALKYFWNLLEAGTGWYLCPSQGNHCPRQSPCSPSVSCHSYSKLLRS